MIEQVVYFAIGILLPYFAEQYAYSKLIPSAAAPESQGTKTITQGYGWRFVWDMAFFLLLIYAGYRLLFTTAPLAVLEWFGYFCFLFGITLRIWALKELGMFYDSGIALQADHQLVRSGPYHILRHPLHVGTFSQITGLALFAPMWLGAPAVIASLILCLYLNRTEDKTHLQKFGAEFTTYYVQTWDFIDLVFWKNNRSRS